jgi:hypothetical protein
MATILWTTAQYSDKPVELSATPLVITQAKCVGVDNSASALKNANNSNCSRLRC